MIDVPFRNPTSPSRLTLLENINKIYGTISKDPYWTTPVLSNNEITRHLLWLQTFHEQPILGGLGDHISSHRPRQYRLHRGQSHSQSPSSDLTRNLSQLPILPDDVDALLQDGFTFVVVDPATYSPGLENTGQRGFVICQGIWGEPTFRSALLKLGKIRKFPQTVYIENIPPVEHAGPRTEDGFVHPSEPEQPSSPGLRSVNLNSLVWPLLQVTVLHAEVKTSENESTTTSC